MNMCINVFCSDDFFFISNYICFIVNNYVRGYFVYDIWVVCFFDIYDYIIFDVNVCFKDVILVYDKCICYDYV